MASETRSRGDVQIRFDLWSFEFGRAGLDLNEARPCPPAAARLKDPVWIDRSFARLERHLDERAELTTRRSKTPNVGRAKLAHRAHHREQRRCRPALSLVGAADAARRDEPSLLPVVFRHRYSSST